MPAFGYLNTATLRSKFRSLFLTTLYQQDVESGQEQLILLVVAGAVTGRSNGEVKWGSLNTVMPK